MKKLIILFSVCSFIVFVSIFYFLSFKIDQYTFNNVEYNLKNYKLKGEKLVLSKQLVERSNTLITDTYSKNQRIKILSKKNNTIYSKQVKNYLKRDPASILLPFSIKRKKIKDKLIKESLMFASEKKLEFIKFNDIKFIPMPGFFISTKLKLKNSLLVDHLYGFSIFSSDNKESFKSLPNVIYDKSQKRLKILTGNILLQLKKNTDLDFITNEYLDVNITYKLKKLNYVNIKLKSLKSYIGAITRLKQDKRVNSFYPEIIDKALK
jgi:hypothetical protein